MEAKRWDAWEIKRQIGSGFDSDFGCFELVGVEELERWIDVALAGQLVVGDWAEFGLTRIVYDDDYCCHFPSLV